MIKEWRDLFKPETETKQLRKHVQDINATWKDYRSNTDEVTHDLIQAGLVLKPEITGHDTDSWHNAVRDFLELGRKQHVIISIQPNSFLITNL